MEGQSAILDLLFDKTEGILKEDVPNGLEPLDFSSLDLMTGGEFDDFLFDGVLLSEEKKIAPQISAHTDHDYVMQPVTSPASSDSGVSVDSGKLSPRNINEETFTHNIIDANSMSGSPSSVSQFSPQMLVNSPDRNSVSGDGLSRSPNAGNQIGLDTLEFENFDFSDMNFDALDACALAEDNNGENSILDEDVAIDLGNHSDLMTFGTTTNVTQNPDGSETKTIKIIKVSAADTLPFTMKDVSTDTQRSGSFPELKLTEEEKDLLAREGIALPTNMPLTKEEERQLKGIRRKIRNKVSAKESRKRKMDYVEGLEKRVKICTQENQTLNKKVDSLEKRNVTLINQLKKLQLFINLRSTKTAQASTCVMVLLLSFAFLVVPNFNPMGGDDDLEDLKTIRLPGKSRNLLHDAGDLTPSDTDNPYGITMRPSPFWEYPPKTPVVQEQERATTSKEEDELINDLEVDIGSDSSDSKKKTENVIYVQIEKDAGTSEESNVTYVFTEEGYKKDVQQATSSGLKQDSLVATSSGLKQDSLVEKQEKQSGKQDL